MAVAEMAGIMLHSIFAFKWGIVTSTHSFSLSLKDTFWKYLYLVSLRYL